MASVCGSFPVLKQYLAELDASPSLQHARDWFNSYRDSGVLRELENDCSRLSDFFLSMVKGQVAPPLRAGATNLPLVHNAKELALPNSKNAEQIAETGNCRAVLVLRSIPPSAVGYFEHEVQRLLDFGSYALLVQFLTMCFGLFIAYLAIYWEHDGYSFAMLGIWAAIWYHNRRLAPKAKWAKEVYSTFYLLSFNPPWPVGARCDRPTARGYLEKRIWAYHCIGHGPWFLRSQFLMAFFGVYSMGYAVPPDGLMAYAIGLVVLLSVGFFFVLRGNSSVFLRGLEEFERGLDEMLKPGYSTIWLDAIAEEYRNPLADAFELMARLRDLGISLQKIDPEAIMLKRFNDSPPIGSRSARESLNLAF